MTHANEVQTLALGREMFALYCGDAMRSTREEYAAEQDTLPDPASNPEFGARVSLPAAVFANWLYRSLTTDRVAFLEGRLHEPTSAELTALAALNRRSER